MPCEKSSHLLWLGGGQLPGHAGSEIFVKRQDFPADIRPFQRHKVAIAERLDSEQWNECGGELW